MNVQQEIGLGLWGSLAFDRFGGDGYTDDLGDRVSVEPLDRLLLLAGGRLRFLFEEAVFQGNPIFLDLRAGGGMAYFEEVEGVFHVGGSVTKGVEVFDASVRAAAEAGVSAGVASRTFSFDIGVGFRLMGGPKAGEGVSSTIDPGVWFDVAFELGWEYRF